MGGGGAVGFAAIQLAVAAGCPVTTTCGSQSVDRMLAAGVEQAVDYVAEVVFNFCFVSYFMSLILVFQLLQTILFYFFVLK